MRSGVSVENNNDVVFGVVECVDEIVCFCEGLGVLLYDIMKFLLLCSGFCCWIVGII